MAPYRRIGVFGATGRVGKEITRALVDAGLEVIPFSRQKTASPTSRPKTPASADLSLSQTVAGIPTQEPTDLSGIDAVVSTVGLTGKQAQLDLIQQAKRQGVKRFIASEYGVHPSTNLGKSDFFAQKREMRQVLSDADFPDGWKAIASGFFDDILPLLIKPDRSASSLTLVGKGDVLHPFTLRRDIGRVLAATFQQPEKYKDTWVTVVNGWYTLEEIAAQFEGGWTVQKVPTDMRMPILHLAEVNGWDVVPRGEGRELVGVQLEDFGGVIERFVGAAADASL